MKAVVRTWAFAFSLGHFDFRLFMFGSHTRNQDEFTVSFISRRKSCSYFSRKLFKFWAYANSLDHLDFSLAVFYNKNFISGSKFLYQSMKGMLELVLVLFLLAISISDYIYILLAHKVEIRMNSLSLSFWDGNSSSYFLRKLFKLWAYAISLVFFRKQIFISLIINEGSC